jgi:hypothetical protein
MRIQYPKGTIGSIKALILASFVVSCSGGSTKVENQGKEEAIGAEHIHLTSDELRELGIFIKDSAIMYNNRIEGIGSIDIVVRDTKYSRSTATTNETNLGFYPRYITTLDTVQRSVYMISGDRLQSEQEAQKWQLFDDLAPIIVEQKIGDKYFGETLIFWMTKTPELDQKLKDFDNR